MNHRPFPRQIVAFSLVEVVLALGLISFALIAMIGLFGVGLQTGKQSEEYTQAGNLASALLLKCRGTSNAPGFPALTNVTSVLSNSFVVGIQGTSATNGLPAYDIYNVRYRIAPGSTTHLVNVYLLLWWPAQSANPSPGSYYETTTQIATP